MLAAAAGQICDLSLHVKPSVLSCRALYHCNYCQRDISDNIRIKCATCADFDLCVECFSVGVEINGHNSGHNYKVMDNLSFPIFHPNWGVSGVDRTWLTCRFVVRSHANSARRLAAPAAGQGSKLARGGRGAHAATAVEPAHQLIGARNSPMHHQTARGRHLHEQRQNSSAVMFSLATCCLCCCPLILPVFAVQSDEELLLLEAVEIYGRHTAAAQPHSTSPQLSTAQHSTARGMRL